MREGKINMEKTDPVRLRVRFGTWAWAELPGGDVEVQLDPFKPKAAAVAEGVEALVREQMDGGAGREVRVEPTSWNEYTFRGIAVVSGADGQYERTSYAAEVLPRPSEPRHADE